MIVGVRHAEVWNPGHVVYATLPGFHLSDPGRAEAGRLAHRLSAAPVVAVHASPLDRAQETATILAEPHGLAVCTDDRLLEWAFWAHWEGMPWDRIRDRDPGLLEAYASDPASVWPEAPLEAAGRRIVDWAADADRVEGPGPDRIVLGVTHEAPLIAAMLVGRGEGLRAFHSTNLPHLALVRLRPPPPERMEPGAVGGG